MPDPSLNSTVLVDLLSRWRAGDREAGNELVRRATARLEKLARRMCKSYPNVKEMAETSDVMQNSLCRLL